MPIEIVVAAEAQVAAEEAARPIAAAVRAKPDIVLGLATGETMRPVHAALVADRRRSGTDYSRVRIFNLDDYVGVSADHPASFRRFMRETLLMPLGIGDARADMPDGMAADIDAEAGRYEAAIAAAGGIDLQVLGIGRNGHIAFNEPGSAFDSPTRVVALAEETRRAAAVQFAPAQAPMHGITMGIGTILRARRILLVATGAAKRDSLARALRDPPDEACPASALQAHGAVTIVADVQAWPPDVMQKRIR